MHWLYLLLALGALLFAFSTPNEWLLLLSLLASLGLFLAWLRGWYLDRIGDRARDESAMIDPTELRRLRELAAARKREAADAGPRDHSPPSA